MFRDLFAGRRRPARITTEPRIPPRGRSPNTNGVPPHGATDKPDTPELLMRLQEKLEMRIAQAGLEVQAGMGVQFNELTELLRGSFDPVYATLVARLHADADAIRTEFVDRSVEEFDRRTVEKWDRLNRDIAGLVEGDARQALLAPIVTQLLAVHDRILSEVAFQAAFCRRLEATSLDTGVRAVFEQCESAQRSYVAELRMLLASLGVEPLETAPGPIKPRLQHVVGVEPTASPELDGHVARVVAAGFTWNGAIHRLEKVIAYKLEKK